MYPHIDEIEKEATEVFKKCDLDNNGYLDYGEWCVATVNKRELLNNTNLTIAFQLFDRDKGGSIDAQEVATILGKGLNVDSPEVWDQLIKEVDLNGDGKIDFTEFK
jgi:calcium-dependent protein kinase